MPENSGKKDWITVYISGAITGTADYEERFEAAECLLCKKRFKEVINPAAISALLPKGMPWDTYMEVMLPLLRHCDAVYMLRGWEKSTGARIEREYAVKLGLVVIEEDER